MEFIRNYLTRRKLNKLASSLKENGDVFENIRRVTSVLHTLYNTNVSVVAAEATIVRLRYKSIRDIISVLSVTTRAVSRGASVDIKEDYSTYAVITLYDFCLIDNSGNYIDPDNIVSTLCPILDELIFNLTEIEPSNPLHDYYSRVLRRVTQDLHVLATCIYGVNERYESKKRKES